MRAALPARALAAAAIPAADAETAAAVIAEAAEMASSFGAAKAAPECIIGRN